MSCLIYELYRHLEMRFISFHEADAIHMSWMKRMKCVVHNWRTCGCKNLLSLAIFFVMLFFVDLSFLVCNARKHWVIWRKKIPLMMDRKGETIQLEIWILSTSWNYIFLFPICSSCLGGLHIDFTSTKAQWEQVFTCSYSLNLPA